MDVVAPPLAAVVWILSLPFAASAEEVPVPSTPAEDAARIVVRGDYQRDLPGTPSSDRPGTPAERDDRHSRGGRRSPPSGRDSQDRGLEADGSQGGGSIALPLMIVGAIVFAGLTAWILLTRRAGKAAAPAAPKLVPKAQPVETTAGAPVDPVLALVESGSFAEAVHAVLLEVLARLGRRLSLSIGRGTTSREIVPRVDDPSRREALRELVLLVEQSRFGERPLAREHVDRALSLAATILAPQAAAA